MQQVEAPGAVIFRVRIFAHRTRGGRTRDEFLEGYIWRENKREVMTLRNCVNALYLLFLRNQLVVREGQQPSARPFLMPLSKGKFARIRGHLALISVAKPV